MKDEQILANAPDGAESISVTGHYIKQDCGKTYFYHDASNEWVRTDMVILYCDSRSLADIKTIVELKKQIAELEKKCDEYHAMVVYTGAIMEQSTGVAGWHLNGDIAEWDELFTVSLYKDVLKANSLGQQKIGVNKYADHLIEIGRLDANEPSVFRAREFAKHLREDGDK